MDTATDPAEARALRLLAALADPDPRLTVDFVGPETAVADAFARAQEAHLEAFVSRVLVPGARGAVGTVTSAPNAGGRVRVDWTEGRRPAHGFFEADELFVRAHARSITRR